MELKRNICRLCLTTIVTENVVTLEDIQHVAQKCIPEVDASLVDDNSICKPCVESLRDYFIFIMDCSYIEEKINEYQGYAAALKVRLSEFLRCKLMLEPEEVSRIQNPALESAREKLIFNRRNDRSDTTQNKRWSSPQKSKITSKEPRLNPEVTLHCERCNFQTKKDRDFERHKLMHERLEAAAFRCKICKYNAKGKERLELHMSSHESRDKTFSCGICGFEAIAKGVLRNHILGHRKETTFKCENCNYETRRRADLKKHILRET